MSNCINLIYLLGAGRSGTTLLATLLNNHDNIKTLGEVNQFYEFLEENKNCSCGKSLRNCTEWNVSANFLKSNISSRRHLIEKEEAHGRIPRLLIGKTINHQYLTIQEEVYSHIHQQRNCKWYLDSSKYIARYLLLKKSKKLHIKGIYIVRDPRGVVYSFQKKVQTSKKPLSALLYYNAINFFSELVYMKDNSILKIRYEDLVEKPKETLSKVYTHIFEEQTAAEDFPEYFETPHIVGGNRMKTQKKIKIQPDKKWESLKYYKRVLYYILALPFSFINNYKL
ncbi:sulfotransferase [Psychroflexus lacisalsi]|uniref:Sulfotransferase n=1 Tax=Psychroflexus lacisalsi TaxID=503928 RepID=A0ABN1K046_9FLAO|nr:sulfotransferase [Psychroflexus lacisalsi]MBZ9620992.1 sulfotransferase [Psychroflexus lacisalsi]